MTGPCAHLSAIRDVTPRTPNGCEECLATGGRWVHLRLCLSCGHVGCCDSSPNRHASAHFRQSHHPIVQSFEPGERWRWCYADETYLDD
ncbi:MAG: ubiquitin carboxyl-terminal hydrolase 14 [Gemmatimonadales bacterium]